MYVLFVALALTGCTFLGKGEEVVFIGTVLEINETSLLVEPQAGSNELKFADKISVSIKETPLVDAQSKEITADQISIGDRVEITYSGEIAESYPAQINKCYKIKLID